MAECRGRILVVDDDEGLRELLVRYLSDNGYEAAGVADGQAMKRHLSSHPVDLLLLDVMLPRLSGFDVCQRIRANPAWRALRVVMLSAKGRDVEVTKGLALGADAYVTKPFAIQDLLDEVARQLGRAPQAG